MCLTYLAGSVDYYLNETTLRTGVIARSAATRQSQKATKRRNPCFDADKQFSEIATSAYSLLAMTPVGKLRYFNVCFATPD